MTAAGATDDQVRSAHCAPAAADFGGPVIKPSQRHGVVSFERGKIECRCGWGYASETPYLDARTRDELLDRYNAHRQALRQAGRGD